MQGDICHPSCHNSPQLGQPDQMQDLVRCGSHAGQKVASAEAAVVQYFK